MGVRSKQFGSMVNVGDLYLTGTVRITSTTNAFKFTGACVSAAAGGYAAGTLKRIQVDIGGVTYYMLAATGWVTKVSPSVSPSASRSPSSSASPST